MKVKVGYVYNNFSLAVDLIKQGRFDWMIVELSMYSYLYLVLRQSDSHYISRLLDWQGDHNFVYLNYQCFYNPQNTSFRRLYRDLTRIGGQLDINVKLQYSVIEEPYRVSSKLNQGCAVVFLEHTGTLGNKTYHICVQSKKLKDILSSLGYSPAYLPGVSAICFDAGGNTLEQIGEKIEQAARPRAEQLTRSRL